MSRRKKKRPVEVKEIEYFGPDAGHRLSFAERVERWLLWGNSKDKEAVGQLFPLPGNVLPNEPRS